MLPCAAASLPPTDPHLQCNSSLATDIKELYSAGQRATSGARESPFTMPFILGERDTKDSAHTLLHMPKNKRRRLDKNRSPFARVCARTGADSAQQAAGMLAIDEGPLDAADVSQPAAPKKRSGSRWVAELAGAPPGGLLGGTTEMLGRTCPLGWSSSPGLGG